MSDNTFEFDNVDDEDIAQMSGAGWLKEPGIYHVLCLKIENGPADNKGNPINGIRAKFKVVAGDQVDKAFEQVFFNPGSRPVDEAKLAGWRMSVRKQANLMIALGLASTEELTGKNGSGKTTINLDNAVGRQCIIDLHKRNPDDRFLDLNYANIWHVDDPQGLSALPLSKRSAAALAEIPAANRRKPDSFPAAKAASPATAAPPAKKVDYSAL